MGIQRLHGGLTATLLDQGMGTLISYKYEGTCATAELDVMYKVAVMTPCVVPCRAKVVREKGRRGGGLRMGWVAFMQRGEGRLW